MGEDRTIRTSSGELRLRADGVISFCALPGVEHDASRARENLDAARSLVDGRRLAPVLVDLRQTGTLTREARTAYANADFAAAQALVVGSAFSRIIASLFLRIDRPSHPCRVFTCEAEAVAWLLQAPCREAAAR